MKYTLLIFLILFAGCATHKDTWRAEYYTALDKWEKAYEGDDANIAYQETLAFTEYVKKMERDGIPFESIPQLLIWNYARLGLLADHLGEKEEASRYFAIAVRYSKVTYPNAPASEAGFRSALDQMDTPDKYPWRKK
jgi:hypothetical protein